MHYSLVKTQKEKKITKIRTFSNNKYNIPLNLQIVYIIPKSIIFCKKIMTSF